MLRKLLNLKQIVKYGQITRNLQYNFCSVDASNLPVQVDYNQIMIKIGKAKVFEDKFNILLMKNTQQIFDLVYKPRVALSLNDYIKILEQLTKVCEGQTYKQIYGIEKILSKIEENLKLCNNNTDIVEDEHSPYIGSLMKSLNMIEYYKNMELWMKICDQICQERMDFTSREIRESLLGLFIIRRLSSQEWQQNIVQKSIRILLSYFEVHLSKNQFNLEDIVTLGYALYQHYGSDYLKNKTYILQTIEMNASTQINTLQDELYYSQKGSSSTSQQSQNSNNSNFTSTSNEDYNSGNSDDIIEEKQMKIESDIKSQLIQIAFLFSLCDYKSSYIFNQIAYYFSPSELNSQKIQKFFEDNRYLLSKFFYYLVHNYQRAHITNLDIFLNLIDSNILSYNGQLNQHQMQLNFQQQTELQNQATEDYKIVYKRDLHYDDIKQEEYIFQQFHNKKCFSLQDLCLILESALTLNIKNLTQWLEEIDISFSHLEPRQCFLMDLIRFWKARLAVQQLEFVDSPNHLLELLKQKSIDCRFSQNDVISFIQFCDEEKVAYIFIDLYNYLPYYAANNIFFYSWEEMCFLYYHFIKDKILFKESQVSEINGRLNVLKQYIKLEYFSYNNRKNNKMSTESNFYKVLSVVDLNEFYSESTY